VYDSIHEAVTENIDPKAEIKYGSALEEIWRPVVSEGEFYLGIMGCWTKEMINFASKAIGGQVSTNPEYEGLNWAQFTSDYDSEKKAYIIGDKEFRKGVPIPRHALPNSKSINLDEEEYYADCMNVVKHKSNLDVMSRSNATMPNKNDKVVINTEAQTAFSLDRKGMVREYIKSIGGGTQKVMVIE